MVIQAIREIDVKAFVIGSVSSFEEKQINKKEQRRLGLFGAAGVPRKVEQHIQKKQQEHDAKAQISTDLHKCYSR